MQTEGHKKTKVPHITLKEYVGGKDRAVVDFVLKYGEDFEPKPLFEKGGIFSQTFGYVKDAQELLNYTGLTFTRYVELLEERLGVEAEKIYEMSVYKLHEAKLWLKESIIQINQIESEQLGRGISSEEQRAGIERFEKYKTFPQYDKLAGGDPLKYKDIENLEYSVAFTKLKLEADRADFNEDLFRIRNPKKPQL